MTLSPLREGEDGLEEGRIGHLGGAFLDGPRTAGVAWDAPHDVHNSVDQDPDDFHDGTDQSDEESEEYYRRFEIYYKHLAKCIAADLLSGGRLGGGRDHCAVAEAASHDDPTVHRAYLAAAVATYRTLNCDGLRDLSASCTRLGRAMEARRQGQEVVRVANLGLASQIKPSLKLEEAPHDLTDIQEMWVEIQDYRYAVRQEYAKDDDLDAFDTHEEWLKSCWDATLAIALLHGDEGLREILAFEEVHRAIRECHDTLRWPIGWSA